MDMRAPMSERVNPDYLLPIEPRDIPGLVSYWHFQDAGEEFVAQQGKPYKLSSRSGPLQVVHDAGSPMAGRALRLEEGQWLSIPRRECPDLDFHGARSGHTVVAWINRGKTRTAHCEFIAGQWNESNRGRQYGLFLNITVWGLPNRICGHLSNVGGPTPGYKYCIDGSMGATEVPWDQWSVVAMSYDGYAGTAWLNGLADLRPGLNPYPMAGGLHDSGPNGSDFTVGAVDRSGQIGNFFCGLLGGLAVYRRALTPAEMYALACLKLPGSGVDRGGEPAQPLVQPRNKAE